MGSNRRKDIFHSVLSSLRGYLPQTRQRHLRPFVRNADSPHMEVIYVTPVITQCCVSLHLSRTEEQEDLGLTPELLTHKLPGRRGANLENPPLPGKPSFCEDSQGTAGLSHPPEQTPGPGSSFSFGDHNKAIND